MWKKTIIFFLIFLFPFIFLFFRTNNFFVFHDGIFHLERTFDFFEGISEGHFPVRWSTRLNNNFGSPIFIFLFPVPYIISSIFYLLSHSLIFSYKISNIFFILIFISGICILLKRIFKNTNAALFGSAVAVFTPYFLVQIFVRGAFREMAAMSVFPWMIYSLMVLCEKKDIQSFIKFIVVSSICFLSDGLTLLTMFPFLILFFGYLLNFQKEKLKTFLIILLSSVFSFGISAFIIFPYLFESQFINPNLVYDFFLNHFVLIKNIFSLRWGFGFSEKWFVDRIPLQFGFLQILLVCFGIIFLFKEKRKEIKLLIIFLLVNIFFVTLLSVENPISLYVWKKIYFVRTLQFPWRFYSSLPLTFSLIGSYVFVKIKSKISSKLITAVLICLPIILSFKYLKTNQIFVVDEKEMIKSEGQASAFHEFIPKTRDSTSFFIDVKDRYFVISGKMKIENYKQNSHEISFSSKVDESGTVQINQLYFPGWELFDNGLSVENRADFRATTTQEKIKTTNKDDSGLMRLNLNKGNHRVLLVFKETGVRAAGNLLSLLSMTLTLGLYIIGLLRERRQ